MSNKKGTKKLNRLDIKKETIADLNVQNDDQIKGGTIASAPPHCPGGGTGTTVIAPPATTTCTRTCR